MSTERGSASRIVISYRAGDVGEAESIARLLTAAGLRPWFDRWDLVPGSDRLASVNRAIAEAETVLELIGVRADERGREAERPASTEGTPRLVPVLLPQAIGLPAALADRHPVDLRGLRLDSIEAVTALVHAVMGPPDPDVRPQAGTPDDLQRALGHARRILGEDHPETLLAAANLATTLYLGGEYGVARRMLEDVVERSRGVFGEENPFTVTASANLAAALWALGSYQQSLQLLDESIAVAGRVLEPGGVEVARLHGNLASVLYDLGDHERALDESREALRISEAVLGPDHPAVAGRRVYLGDLLESVGRPAAAAEEYRRARRSEALSEDEGNWLTGVEIFSGLEPAAQRQIMAVATRRAYRKGERLFAEDDPGESLIIVRRGAVAVFRTAPTGERAVLAVVRAPDVIGEVSLLDSSARSASAEAIEDSQTLSLSRSAFFDLVRADSRILDAVMRSAGRLIRRLTEQKTDHVFLDLPGRVAKTLVRLAGDSQAPLITIELNQSQLAEMADGSRQSVNQAIGSFASRGWLHTEGRRIVVSDLPALRRRAGMAGSNEARRSPEGQGERRSPTDGVLGFPGWSV